MNHTKMRAVYLVVAFLLAVFFLSILFSRVARGPSYPGPFHTDVSHALSYYYAVNNACPENPADEKFLNFALRNLKLDFQSLSVKKNLYCVRVKDGSNWLVFEYTFVGAKEEPRIERIGTILGD